MSVNLYEMFPGKTGSGDASYEESGWTEAADADALVAPDTRHRFGTPAFGNGEECLKLVVRPGNRSANIEKTDVSAATNSYCAIGFCVGSTNLLDLADGSYHINLRLRDSSGNNAVQCKLRKNGSALKFIFSRYSGGSLVESAYQATIQVGVWYLFECRYGSSIGWAWKLTGGAYDGTVLDSGTLSSPRANVARIKLGFQSDTGTAHSETTLYVSRVVLADNSPDAWIGQRPINDYAYQNIAWMDQVSVVEASDELPAYSFGLGHAAVSQVAWTASLATQAGAQAAYGRGFERLIVSGPAFAAGVAGLSLSAPAYVSGQGSSQAVTSQRAAWLRGADRLQASRFAYAAGIGAAAHAISAFLQGALGTSGQQGAYLGGSGSHLEASLPAFSAAFAGLAVQSAAYVVCGLPQGKVGFQSGVEQLVFSCPRLYPLRQPRERLQVICRTAGGTVRVQDKGLGVRRLRLAFRGLSAEDYAALERWFETVSVGALHPFTLIDEAGGESLVRWTGGFDFEQTASGRWAGEIQLEEVAISEVNA